MVSTSVAAKVAQKATPPSKASKRRSKNKKQDAQTVADHEKFKEAVLVWWREKGARDHYDMTHKQFSFRFRPYVDFMALHGQFKRASYKSHDKTRQWFVQILTREEGKDAKKERKPKKTPATTSAANKETSKKPTAQTPAEKEPLKVPLEEKIIVELEDSDDGDSDDSMSDAELSDVDGSDDESEEESE